MIHYRSAVDAGGGIAIAYDPHDRTLRIRTAGAVRPTVGGNGKHLARDLLLGMGRRVPDWFVEQVKDHPVGGTPKWLGQPF